MTLRFVIISEHRRLAVWQAKAVQHLNQSGLAKPAAWITIKADEQAPAKLRRVQRISRRNLFGRFASRQQRTTDEVVADALLAGLPSTCLGDIDNAVSRRFVHSAVDMAHWHFALAFAAIRPPAALLATLPYGIWAFFHGDREVSQDAPVGFWELFEGRRCITASLVRLTESADRVAILHQGVFKSVRHSLHATRERVLSDCAEWPLRICRELSLNGAECLERPVVTVAWRSPVHPSPATRLLLLLQLMVGFMSRAYEELLLAEKWNLGVLQRPISSLLDQPGLEAVRWFKELSDGHYLADPFHLKYQECTIVLAEEFDGRRHRGHITAFEIGHCDTRKIVMQMPAHMSYPYLIEHAGMVYCVPETSQARQVILMQADIFPTQWSTAGVLIEEFPGVDCTVFQHRDLWWLFCGNHGDQDHTKLFGWYSEDLFGPWRPHALNPLKTDVRSSRSAGRPFYHDNVLYRPAQDCSMTYGGAVTINRILKLSPTVFEEVPAVSVVPAPDSPYPAGVHTICGDATQILIDSKRHYVSARKGLRVVRDRIQALGLVKCT